MESEDKPYVIISQQEGNTRLDVGTDLNSYESDLGACRSGSGSVIFCRYGITQEKYDLALEARDGIHEKPYVEVKQKVKGLVGKLTGETQ